MRHAKLALLLLGALTVGIAGGGFTDAAFTAQSQNPGNTFTAASSFGCSQAPVTIQQASQSPKVVEDAWVDQGAAGTPQTDTSPLNVRSSQTGQGPRNRRAFVKFTIPTTPAGCKVVGANLRLYNQNPARNRTIQVVRSAVWPATALTWTNQPAGVAGDTPVTATTTNTAGPMTWNVTTLVAAGAGNGFVIRDHAESESGEQQFTSSEGTTAANRPQLVITYG